VSPQAVFAARWAEIRTIIIGIGKMMLNMLRKRVYSCQNNQRAVLLFICFLAKINISRRMSGLFYGRSIRWLGGGREFQCYAENTATCNGRKVAGRPVVRKVLNQKPTGMKAGQMKSKDLDY